jgi:hypothetical protein
MKRAVSTLVLVSAALTLSACGSSPAPSQSACKAALVQELKAGEQGVTGTEPAACKGLSNAVIQQLAAEVLSGSTGTP